MTEKKTEKPIEKYEKSELILAIKKLPAQVKELGAIKNQEDLARCENALEVIARMRKAILGMLDPIRDQQYKAYKLTLDTIRDIKIPLDSGEKQAKLLMATWVTMQKQKQKAEMEKKLEVAKEKVMEETAEAEDTGDEEVIEEQKIKAVADLELAKMPPVLDPGSRTTFTRKTYDYTIENIDEIPTKAELPDGKEVYLTRKLPHMAGLRVYVDAWGDKKPVPGLKIYEKVDIIRKRSGSREKQEPETL